MASSSFPDAQELVTRATGGNPYEVARAQLVTSFYPVPAPGFAARLSVLLGLTAYVFAITITFLILYYIALRRQGKKVWIWRLVIKPEGTYITACIYTASVLPTIIAAALIGALIGNDKDIYVDRKAQYRTFLWRNIIWVVVWLQGWISAYANVQAVLITSTDPMARWVPKLVNALYIAVPTAFISGLLVPGVLCSKNYDVAFAQYEQILVLLDQSASYFQRTGQVDVNTVLPLATLKRSITERLALFSMQYRALLIIWAVGSFLLVAVNMAGIFLVTRLRRQVKRGIIQQDTDVFTLPRLSAANFFTQNPHSSDDYELSGSSKTSLSPPPMQVATLARSPIANEAALKKLIRDLVLTLCGVTFLALTFASDTILLAVEQARIYSTWAKTEVSITMIIWAYLVVAGLVMTGIAVNEGVFLYRTSSTPLRSHTSSADLEKDSQRRAAITEAVQVTTHRDVVVESSQVERPQSAYGGSRTIPRIPVPVLSAIPSFTSISSSSASMVTASEGQGIAL